MIRNFLLACLLSQLIPAWSVFADDHPPDSGTAVIVLRHCIIEYEQTSQLGPTIRGVIQDCLVRRGERVKAGQVIGRLWDQDVRAEMELNAVEAESEISIKVSETGYTRALSRFQRTQKLSNQRFTSVEQYTMDKLDVERARLAVEEAKLHRHLAQLRHRHAQALVRAREFVSPFDGVVVDILKYPGESVIESDHVFRVVNVDRLRVTGFLNVSDLWQVRHGQRTRISVEVAREELAIERETFSGQIDFIDSQFDPMTRTCKVIAEVENRDGLLRSGLDARMEIMPMDDASAKTCKSSYRKPRPDPANLSHDVDIVR